MSTNLPPRKTPPVGDSEPASIESDKDQYSLDEMMKALRDKEREKEEKGEVVTRSDGTVARKVKRRKRRSEQPEKASPEKEKKGLMVKVVIGAVLVLLLLLGGLFLVVHQNSKGFREGLEQEVADWTGAEVELGGFKRLPLSCQINNARFKWGEDYFVRDLTLNKVNGDVGFLSFFGARPGGLQLGGNSGKMTLQTPSGKWKGAALTDEDKFPFGFAQYYCEELDVDFGAESPVSFRDASVILSHEGQEGYQVTLDDGFFKVEGWEDFSISSGLMRFKEGMIDVKSLSLEHSKENGLSLGSSLELSGMVPLQPGKEAELKISTGNFPLGSLVGKRLARFIDGSLVSSEGKVKFSVGTEELEEIQIDFKGNEARMAGFPFLANLEVLFPDGGFDQLEFNEGISQAPLRGTLRVRPEGMAIEDLELARKGKVQLEGGFIIGLDDRIRGEFKVTLNRVFFTTHPKLNNSPLLAGSSTSGYVQLKFKVGGTVKKPTDNFMEMIMVGLNTSSVTPRRPKERDLWEQLQQPEEVDVIPDELKKLEELGVE